MVKLFQAFLFIITAIHYSCEAQDKEMISIFNQANEKASSGDYKSAIEDFTKLINLNPSYPKAYYDRANAKYMIQDYKGAIEDFDKAVVFEPVLIEGYYYRGLCYYELKNYQESIEDYNTAITLNPYFEIAYLSRGEAKVASNDKAGGCLDIHKAFDLGYERAEEAWNKYCK